VLSKPIFIKQKKNYSTEWLPLHSAIHWNVFNVISCGLCLRLPCWKPGCKYAHIQKALQLHRQLWWRSWPSVAGLCWLQQHHGHCSHDPNFQHDRWEIWRLQCKMSSETETDVDTFYFKFQLNLGDISPNYAGFLMGISNMFANIPGFLAPLVNGAIIGDKVCAHK
jgi:hypothetical protein